MPSEKRRGAPVHGVTRADALADQAYVAIRDAITSGRLASGSKVTERALAEQLGVSATPVREALRQLEQEMLVERVGIRERRITNLPNRIRRETVYIYAVLRGVAARFAAITATDTELKAIATALDRAENSIPDSPVDEIIARFERFHQLIESATQNPVLQSMIGTAKAFEPSYRARSVEEQVTLAPAELKERIGDHRAILNALLARDAQRAEEVMREHQLRAGESYLRYPGRQEEPSC
jgi:DNA-binding GntR family transcriptional regulator